MGRLPAVAFGAAFFLIAICCSPVARACENCDSRKAARLDVTGAVDSAISFVVTTMRKLRPSYEVLIVAGDAAAPLPTVAEYAAAYDGRDGQPSVELPGFKHRYQWQLTYRDELAELAAETSESERLLGTDVTLDDSWVFGLRFELDYGWKR